MENIEICEDIKYIGVNDRELDLFENQYRTPNGMSYNSYIIFDEKIVVLDTVDRRAEEEWFKNLDTVLGNRKPDYLVVLHTEPDHAASIKKFIDKYPDVKVIGNIRTFAMINQFFDIDIINENIVVEDGDEISFGRHSLKFYTAFMVHWPEVMVAYDKSVGLLFSADAFGKFGTTDADEEWTDEARRYYFNIVGKYGAPVQKLLDKLSGLDIKIICSLHGPVLISDIGYYAEKYKLWSSYEPEDSGIVVAFASIHGNTKSAAEKIAEMLKERGEEKIVMFDLARDELSKAATEAFRYDRIILAASTYETSVFSPMYNFLHHLQLKNFQNRKVGIIENGSWCPMAAKSMLELVAKMKDIKIAENIVTIKSALNSESMAQLEKLADEMTVDN